jgi:hypothetical protein
MVAALMFAAEIGWLNRPSTPGKIGPALGYFAGIKIP